MAELLDTPKKKRAKSSDAAEIIEAQGWQKDRNPFDLENYDYEFDESFKPWQTGDSPLSIHSVPDLIRALKENKNIDIDAKVFGVRSREARLFRMGKAGFLEAAKNRKYKDLREGIDTFATDRGDMMGMGGAIGQDYTPLLGGPFTKQLYYTDYIKMHQAAFFAYHHDPVARRLINIVKHFTLGRGFRVDCEDKKALALWDAFSEVNHLPEMMDHLAIELSCTGELMIHWLPNNATKFTYGIPDKEIPKGLLPRIRLTDVSTIWDIITYPEDITRVLGYQQIFPTQWQMFTDGKVPGTKFIYQQIPADQMMHFKVNCFSNEKRGRSDIFPVLSYLKRLRDAVNYSLVAEMKNSAWCIDTTIEGGRTDVAAYIKSQRALGTIPSAGSEFVHTAKVKRDYRSNGASGSHANPVFEWCLSMIAIGSGIPTSYYGSHLSSGSTRAGSIVATEPVAKLFEDRQNVYERILQAISQRLFSRYGVKAKLEFTFPEIITQDRSAKLKDLALSQSQGWFSEERCANIAAQEMGVDDFDFTQEKVEIGTPGMLGEPGAGAEPLTNPAGNSQPKSNGGISGEERSAIKKVGSGS